MKETSKTPIKYTDAQYDEMEAALTERNRLREVARIAARDAYVAPLRTLVASPAFIEVMDVLNNLSEDESYVQDGQFAIYLDSIVRGAANLKNDLATIPTPEPDASEDAPEA